MLKEDIVIWVLALLTLFSISHYIIGLLYPTYNVGEFRIIQWVNKSDLGNMLQNTVYVLTFVMVYLIWRKKSTNMYMKISLLVGLYVIYWPIATAWNMILSMFVESKEYIDPLHYPAVRPFYDKGLYRTKVKPELDKMMKASPYNACISDWNPGFSIGDSGDKCWRSLDIKRMGSFTQPHMKRDYPVLYQLLSDDTILNAFLSILDPGVNIPTHRGYSKGVVRHHLGYKIPKDGTAYISVNGKKYFWKEGESVLFDDMYKHFVMNPTRETRIVLYCDVKRHLPMPLSALNDVFVFLFSQHPVLTQINDMNHKTKKNSE